MIRISYWGSPGISAKLLETLIASPDFKIEFIVSQQDKPRSNRGRELMPTPVKEAGINHNIPVFTPVSLKKNSESFLEEIKKFSVDFNVVFAYGKIIPEKFFNMPRKGTLNFHASLLPKLRGASPIEHSLLLGHEKTGWTMQKMVEALDAGDIYYRREIDVLWEDDFFSLAERLMKELLEFAPDVLKEYSNNRLNPVKQNESEATHCGKIETSAGQIDWQNSFDQIRNAARAMTGRGNIYSFFNNRKTKIFADLNVERKIIEKAGANFRPGDIYKISENNMYIVCGDSLCVPVNFVQPDGKKKLSIKEFVNGYRVEAGHRFESKPE